MNIKNLFMNLAQKVKALEYKLGLIADYVVETGTSGDWTYEKWESGKAVCWCRIYGGVNVAYAWGSIYTTGGVGLVYADYPTNFFIDIPNCEYSFETTGYNFWALTGSNPGTKDRTPQLQLGRATSSNDVGYYANWKAVGKWK